MSRYNKFIFFVLKHKYFRYYFTSIIGIQIKMIVDENVVHNNNKS